MLAGGRVTRGRQKLGDITNVEQQEGRRKSVASTAKQEDPTLVISPKAKECSYPLVDNSALLQNCMTGNERPDHVPLTSTPDYPKLLMENTFLLGQVTERNQIIEYKNLELQKVRTILQKLQVQNLQLAQANTQMLSELNMGKDKLKVLQHELTCTVAALKVKKLNREEKITRPKAYDVARGESGPVPCIQETRHPSSNHRSVSLITELKLKGEKKDGNKRRTKCKKPGKIKPQDCKAESPIHSDDTQNENEHIQLVSPANTNINTDARLKSKIQNEDRKTLLLSAEKTKPHKKRKLLAPSDGQEIRRSKRRESSDNQLHACEHVPAIKSNDISNEDQQIPLVSSGNTNLCSGLTEGEDQNVDKKTSSIDAKTIMQPQKREVKGSSAVQEVPESKLTQSRNTKPDLCVPEFLASKLQSCEREPSVNVRESVHWVTSDSSDLNIFPIEAKQEDADTSFQQHPAKKAGRHQKRKLSAPSQDQEIPRLTLTERPSRRATIGIIYKETPLNVKLRRSD